MTGTSSTWTTICPVEQVPVERGVCALVDGEQVALFRTAEGALHALGNLDPYSRAMVLSRGIVGSRGAAATIASPVYKQVFSLDTGRDLDAPDVGVPVHGVRVRDGLVEVALSA